jgi:hypothetical protein
MVDAREGAEFYLNVPEKLDNPLPDRKYFREHRPVLYYRPLKTWFIFAYDDVYYLFSGIIIFVQGVAHKGSMEGL